jgi:hypothetical protein
MTNLEGSSKMVTDSNYVSFFILRKGSHVWGGGYIVLGLLELGLMPSLPCPQTTKPYLNPSVSTLKTYQIFFSLNTKDYIYLKVPTSLYRGPALHILWGPGQGIIIIWQVLELVKGPKCLEPSEIFNAFHLANRPCDTGTSNPRK